MHRAIDPSTIPMFSFLWALTHHTYKSPVMVLLHRGKLPPHRTYSHFFLFLCPSACKQKKVCNAEHQSIAHIHLCCYTKVNPRIQKLWCRTFFKMTPFLTLKPFCAVRPLATAKNLRTEYFSSAMQLLSGVKPFATLKCSGADENLLQWTFSRTGIFGYIAVCCYTRNFSSQ